MSGSRSKTARKYLRTRFQEAPHLNPKLDLDFEAAILGVSKRWLRRNYKKTRKALTQPPAPRRVEVMSTRAE